MNEENDMGDKELKTLLDLLNKYAHLTRKQGYVKSALIVDEVIEMVDGDLSTELPD
jgi:hypothetical protein